MHLLGWNPDFEGELVLRFSWLPYWLGANAKLRQKVQTALMQSLPKETKVKDMSDGMWGMLDDVVIKTIVNEYPYIHGLDQFLEGLLKVSFRGKDPGGPG